MDTAIRPDAVRVMERRGQLWIQSQPGCYLVRKMRQGVACRTPENACPWEAVPQDELPFLTKSLGIMADEPIVMIEQDKM